MQISAWAMSSARDMGKAKPQGRAEHSWAEQVNPSRSKQGGQKAGGMLPAGREGHNAQGKGPKLLCFHK